MGNFDETAIGEIFDRITSMSLSSGYFDSVNNHEPKSAPGNGVTCSIWAQSIRPVRTSGLAATSGMLILNERIYTSMTQQPFDMIDPNVTAAASYVMGQLSGDFDLGGVANVREIDLLGANGIPLAAVAGYVEIDRKMLRVMTITVPIVVNDMWTQVP
jgi:hypothetical protein